jgi:hypothetical protein
VNETETRKGILEIELVDRLTTKFVLHESNRKLSSEE